MPLDHAARPLARCIRCPPIAISSRTLTTTIPVRAEEVTTSTPSSTNNRPPPPNPRHKRDPARVSRPGSEETVIKFQHQMPIGSRRRRAAIAHTTNIPFSQLPYQCFQEARAVLQEDRKEKVEMIRIERERIERVKLLQASSPDEVARKELRIRSMSKKLQELKILADINDPMVKRRFEDGQGDMTKPIYRHLARLKWESYKRKLMMQRITQMHVVPDVYPAIDPSVSTSLSFGSKNVQHGDIVLSSLSEGLPTLNIQCYDKGERLVTIAVVNPDVPDVARDGFNYRCHFLASNIAIDPTSTRVDFAKLDMETQVIQEWLPAYAQKGTPYQRMSIFIFDQGNQSSLDIPAMKQSARYSERLGFNLTNFADQLELKPIGVDLFRTQYDDHTSGVMQRAGIVGWDVEFKRMKVEPLPYKRISTGRYR